MAKAKPKQAPSGVEARVTAVLEQPYGFRVEVLTDDGVKASFSSLRAYSTATRLRVVLGPEEARKTKAGRSCEPAKGFEDPEAIDDQVKEFFRKIPKTEIHLHVEGAVRPETLLALAKDHGSKTIRTKEDVEKLFHFTNLGEFIQVFITLQDNIDELKDFESLFGDLEHYLKKNRIVYAEVFLAISKFMQKGFAYPDLIELFGKRIKAFQKKTGFTVRMIIDVGRTFGPDSAKSNLDRILAHPHDCVVGIGLGGDERKGPAPLFKETFERARKAGLHVVAHAGEDVGPESVWAALKDLHAERIGHGIAAIEDAKLMAHLAKTRIPVEVSLSSNVFTGRYTRTLSEHPVQKFFPKGMRISVNSDDPTLFGTDLSTEYFYFYKHLGFPVSDLMTMLEDGVMSTFHPEPKMLWDWMKDEIEFLRKRYPLVLF